MRRLTHCMRGAALVAAFVAALVSTAVLAQQPPSPGEIAGVSFTATIVVREGSDPDEMVATVTGRANLAGGFEARLSFPDDLSSFDMVAVGGRLYLRIDDGPWEFVDLSEVQPQARSRRARLSPCLEQLSASGVLGEDREAFIRRLGSFEPIRPEQIGAIPVIHVAGSIDLRGLFEAVGELAGANPACAALFGRDMSPGGLSLDDLPSIRFDVYLALTDRFPYRFRLLVGLPDEGLELQIEADLTPSPVPFDIQAPADAQPFRRDR